MKKGQTHLRLSASALEPPGPGNMAYDPPPCCGASPSHAGTRLKRVASPWTKLAALLMYGLGVSLGSALAIWTG